MSVNCPYCKREFQGSRVNSRHLAKCHPEGSPKVPPCLCGHESTSLTQMKRHRRQCAVWQGRDKAAIAEARRRETSLERHGVVDARRSPAANARRKSTNKARYGAENPFCRDASTFDKVQASVAGKRPVLRGSDNPFADGEVQAKILQHWQEHYGVDNPQQVPAIRERTKQTNMDRYGVEETLASPEIRQQIVTTCIERYGGPAPSCDPEVQAKAKVTNMERFGVPWTSMDPVVRQKQLDTMIKRWGSHFFASDEGKAIVRDTLMERYGVEFPGKIEGHWAKAVKQFQKRYGVDHPLQLSEFLEKARQTCIARYGTPFPGLCAVGMNLLEKKVGAMCSQLIFTGDGAFWRKLPLLGQYKNPDFIVPGPDPGHPLRGVEKVVEVFGDFWHSRMKTGKLPFDHEQELVDAFRDIGIACLVVWEGGVKRDAVGVAERVQQFVGGEKWQN